MYKNNLNLNLTLPLSEYIESLNAIDETNINNWNQNDWTRVNTYIFSPYMAAIKDTYINPLKDIIEGVGNSEHIAALACCSLIDLYMQLTDVFSGRGHVSASVKKYAKNLKDSGALKHTSQKSFDKALRNGLVHTSFITKNNSKLFGFCYSSSISNIDFAIRSFTPIAIDGTHRNEFTTIAVDLLFIQIAHDFEKLSQDAATNKQTATHLLKAIKKQFS